MRLDYVQDSLPAHKKRYKGKGEEKKMRSKSRRSSLGKRAALLAVLMSMAVGSTMTANAAPAATETTEETTALAAGMYVSTQYPGVTAKPGASLTFNLDIDNEEGAPTDLALAVKDIPEGWSGYFQGSGNEISSVHAAVGLKESAASFHVDVPEDAEAGDYDLTITAGDEELALKVTVSEVEKTANTLTTDYAEQEGPTGTTFTFKSTLQNNSSEVQSYSFSNSAPEGWTVAVTPSSASTQVASIDVDPNSSETLSITVTPSQTVAAGDYEIPFKAVSAQESLDADLKVKITGTYDLSLSTSTGALSFDATANEKKSVTLTLTNNGNIDLSNINLTTSSLPTDWTVDFSESTVDTLEAGQSKEITLYCTPSKDSLSGDYELDVKASNENATSTAAFRVTVKTSTSWGIVGIALIAAVAACLVLIIRKFGRH